ncbi:MAG: glycosyltransferase N-terminal domain-containing protein, partial [Kiritimatiellia bacterium]|nr:glycosyltransferase N-terminal domain-containing protein [Kiritimatiellia bacterium]
QRLGIYDKSAEKKLASMPERFLIHAVSVGEIQVAFRFMAEMRAKRPGSAFVLTTTTSTAHALAEKMINKDDVLLYFPVDFPFIVRRVLRQIKPIGLILVESELWPNLVRLSSARNIPIMLLNGRISNRSFRRYRLVRSLVRRILAYFSLCCMQSEQDAERLIELGADPLLVKITGSAKYDIAGSSFKVDEKDENFIKTLQSLGFSAPNLLLVAGSTWPGEELALLKIIIRLRGLFPRLKLVLVPRHAERRKQVRAEITQSGLDFRLWSQCRESGAVGNEPSVLLVDTTGELRAFYSVADVVFIGKSLTAKGGQNPIEAAVCSKPIIVGPHMENFSAVIGDFIESKAVIQAADENALEKAVAGLLADKAERESMGGKACRVVLAKSGAVSKSADLFLNIFRNY